MLNGEPWDNYMNTKTNQTFGNFTMRKLQVENLYTDLINGVPVSEAARVSTVNVIKGTRSMISSIFEIFSYYLHSHELSHVS